VSRTPDLIRLSVSLPARLAHEFDDTWQNMQYPNRSKAVHDALRNFISDNKWMRKETGELMGAIVLVYYLNKPRLVNKILEAQHMFGDIVSSTMHFHLTKDKCMEIIAVKGNAHQANNLTQMLMALKGVKQLKLAAFTP
jgi:CopG family nickel-responsive transcriptional regulator